MACRGGAGCPRRTRAGPRARARPVVSSRGGRLRPDAGRGGGCAGTQRSRRRRPDRSPGAPPRRTRCRSRDWCPRWPDRGRRRRRWSRSPRAGRGPAKAGAATSQEEQAGGGSGQELTGAEHGAALSSGGCHRGMRALTSQDVAGAPSLTPRSPNLGSPAECEHRRAADHGAQAAGQGVVRTQRQAGRWRGRARRHPRRRRWPVRRQSPLRRRPGRLPATRPGCAPRTPRPGPGRTRASGAGPPPARCPTGRAG